jgi:hypothetical protein
MTGPVDSRPRAEGAVRAAPSSVSSYRWSEQPGVLAGTHFGGCGLGPLLSADAIPAVVSRIIPVNSRVMTRRMELPPASHNESPEDPE